MGGSGPWVLGAALLAMSAPSLAWEAVLGILGSCAPPAGTLGGSSCCCCHSTTSPRQDLGPAAAMCRMGLCRLAGLSWKPHDQATTVPRPHPHGKTQWHGRLEPRPTVPAQPGTQTRQRAAAGGRGRYTARRTPGHRLRRTPEARQ